MILATALFCATLGCDGNVALRDLLPAAPERSAAGPAPDPLEHLALQYFGVYLQDQKAGWAEERVLFGKPLAKMQNTQFKMVELYTQISAAKALVRECVRKRVDGEDATNLITMAKLFCGRVSHQVADECIQFHGGYGYMKESMAGRAFVDTRLISIGGGSDETMLHYMAKQLGF